MRTALAMAAIGLLLAFAVVASAAVDQAQLKTTETRTYGQFLTDEEGRALYAFSKDTRGVSTCYGPCAEDWPPVLTTDDPLAGTNVDKAKLSVAARSDGTKQVVYNGMPLYYYVKDERPGMATGQAILDDGGEWNLVAPSGELIETEQPQQQRQQPDEEPGRTY